MLVDADAGSRFEQCCRVEEREKIDIGNLSLELVDQVRCTAVGDVSLEFSQDCQAAERKAGVVQVASPFPPGKSTVWLLGSDKELSKCLAIVRGN
mgnify:CR=1 FL=1